MTFHLGFTSADEIGTPTGGGLVTFHEFAALKEMAEIGPSYPTAAYLKQDERSVWSADERALRWWGSGKAGRELPNLVHFYSGSFPQTVNYLKTCGVKITYTCAAHDKEVSEREHKKLNHPFPYPHLTDPELWKRYSQCYREADVLICPSKKAKEICERYGCENRIEVIPHGCTPLPEKIVPMRKGAFRVGYLGAIGPDKGLMYLLQAWKMLNYRDGSLLVIAGRDSISDYMHKMLYIHGGGAVCLAGWQQNVSDFYNDLHLYVQPSATEGFGIEVLEAMAHARPAIASDMAGAADVCISGVFRACDPSSLASAIDKAKRTHASSLEVWETEGRINLHESLRFTWDKIRQQYIALWRSLLS